MDFASPPAVVEALEARVAHGVFGYSLATDSLLEAIVGAPRAPVRLAHRERVDRLAAEHRARAQPVLRRVRRAGRGGADGHAGLPAVPRGARPARPAADHGAGRAQSTGAGNCRSRAWKRPSRPTRGRCCSATRTTRSGASGAATRSRRVLDFCRRHDLRPRQRRDPLRPHPRRPGARAHGARLSGRRGPHRHAHVAEQDVQPARPQLRLRRSSPTRRCGGGSCARAKGSCRSRAASPSPPPRPRTPAAASGTPGCWTTCAATATPSRRSSPRSSRACA